MMKIIQDIKKRGVNMNLPNKLAMLRMVLVVPFILAMDSALKIELANDGHANGLSISMRIIAFIIFLVASITDYYDGQIARKYNLVTNLGKLLDPLADKLLVISGLMIFVKYDKLSLWIALIIIGRELLVTGLRAIAASEGKIIAAETLGKWKTATQMVALCIMILFPLKYSINNLLMLIPLILTIQSGWEYFSKSKSLLNK